MGPLSRLPAPATKAKLLFAALVIGLVLLARFDWNWVSRPLVRHLAQQAGREIRVDDVDVELGLNPTVRLRGIYIANAPWAPSRPFATAGEASFTVSLRSIWEGRPVVSRLVLVDADVEMLREADGRRNWRLRHPENRGPGRITVHTLEAHRTQIRFVNRETDLDLLATASPRTAEDELTTHVVFKGTYEGAPFAGEADSNGIVSFRGSGVAFPLRGYLVSRSTRVELDGFFTDVFDLGPMDTAVRVAGPSLSLLHPFIRIHPPESRPFDLRAQLAQTGNVYRFSGLQGKVGRTDIAGEATYDRSGERPLVRAQLRSDTAHLEDLRVLVGLPSREPGVRAKEAVVTARQFHLDKLKASDANVALHAKKLIAPGLSMIDSLRVAADLSAGALQVRPLQIGIAGGQALGALVFDARQHPPQARMDVEVRDVRLSSLIPRIAAEISGAAPIYGRVKLAGRGDSLAALVASANGSITARMGKGRISGLADAKLALDFGRVLGLALRGDRHIALNCGAVELDVRDGAATSRNIVFDTEETHTNGIGALNLRDQRWHVVLTPQPRRPGLLTRHASIRLQGSFSSVRASIEERLALRRLRGGAAREEANGCDGAVKVAPGSGPAR